MSKSRDLVELGEYLCRHYPAHLTDRERAIERAIHYRPWCSSQPNPNSRIVRRVAKERALMDDDEVNELLADGPDRFRASVAERMLADADADVVINRCPECGGLARTPRARKCFRCGHQWREPSPLSLKKRLAFAAVLWCILFAAVELGARIYIPLRGYSVADMRTAYDSRREKRSEPQWKEQRGDHPMLPYRPKVEPPDHLMAGLRLVSPDEPKPSDVFRIFCLGGSTTYFGYPHKLEAMLTPDFASRGLRLEVVNAADISWTSAESLVNFALRCVPYEPDAIIVYHAVNDSWPAFGQEYAPDYSHWRKRLVPNEPFWCDKLPRFLEASAAFLLVRARYESGRIARTWLSSMTKYLPDFENDPYHGAEAFRRNMKSICAVARAHDARVLLATQVVNMDAPEKRLIDANLERNDITRSLANPAGGVHLVDAAAMIEGNDELMYDICHFRAHKGGEDRLVEILAGAIRENLAEWTAR